MQLTFKLTRHTATGADRVFPSQNVHTVSPHPRFYEHQGVYHLKINGESIFYKTVG
jgi:hypothetical protein